MNLRTYHWSGQTAHIKTSSFTSLTCHYLGVCAHPTWKTKAVRPHLQGFSVPCVLQKLGLYRLTSPVGTEHCNPYSDLQSFVKLELPPFSVLPQLLTGITAFYLKALANWLPRSIGWEPMDGALSCLWCWETLGHIEWLVLYGEWKPFFPLFLPPHLFLR